MKGCVDGPEGKEDGGEQGLDEKYEKWRRKRTTTTKRRKKDEEEENKKEQRDEKEEVAGNGRKFSPMIKKTHTSQRKEKGKGKWQHEQTERDWMK